MTSPYRAGAPASAQPVRRAWGELSYRLAVALAIGGFAYVTYVHVAATWLGRGVSLAIAAFALLALRQAAAGRRGACPRCGTAVELDVGALGALCPWCKTFLEIDRGVLIASPADRVAARPVFGIEQLPSTLPEVCCVCLAPATRRSDTALHRGRAAVPYCDQHAHGVTASRDAVRFRSLAFATRLAEAHDLALVGTGRTVAPDRAAHRGSSLAVGLGLGAGAALAYVGLGALARTGLVIVPTGPKGVVLWLVIELLGRGWIAAFLAALALSFLHTFAQSFRAAPATRPSGSAAQVRGPGAPGDERL